MKHYGFIAKHVKISVLLLINLCAVPSYSQVGINTFLPDSSSILDIRATDRGLLIPRFTPAQRRSVLDRFQDPANSLTVFDTRHKLFYFLDANETSAADPKGTWKALNPWTLKGAYTNTNSNAVFFMGNVGIGTEDPASELEINGTTTTNGVMTDLVRARTNDGLFLTDNNDRGIFVEDGGRVGINVSDPDDRLDVDGDLDITGKYKQGNSPVLYSDELNNLMVGLDAGLEKGTGYGNILLGFNAGRFIENGDNNICLGNGTGYSLGGDKNICIGTSAGSYGDDNNIIIGHSPRSGLSDGSGNILIGNELSIMGSDHLAIGHINALIEGDFSQNYVSVNGRLAVEENLIVEMNALIEGTLHVQRELTADAGCIGCASDSTLKKQIYPITNALDKVNRLNGYTYYWKESSNQYKHDKDLQMGFMAQEVQNEFPLMVDTAAEGHLYVNYQKMVVPLLISVKELNQKIEDKEKRISDLEERLAVLESMMLKERSASSSIRK